MMILRFQPEFAKTLYTGNFIIQKKLKNPAQGHHSIAYLEKPLLSKQMQGAEFNNIRKEKKRGDKIQKFKKKIKLMR